MNASTVIAEIESLPKGEQEKVAAYVRQTFPKLALDGAVDAEFQAIAADMF
ncbi:MAG: hypothetical protein RLZZ265_1498, partial [Verrucomicrobiota bacterium]